VSLQLKSTFGPVACTSFVSGDWVLLFFDTNWMAGYVVADEVLTLIAMLLPNDALLPLFARSGETAPFQTKSEGSEALPDASGAVALGSSSYQRSSTPAPPKTAWAVQSPSLLPFAGSTAATAASKRPSRVSRR